jgi:DNA-binding beta-propeller fold protein YncE
MRWSPSRVMMACGVCASLGGACVESADPTREEQPATRDEAAEEDGGATPSLDAARPAPRTDASVRPDAAPSPRDASDLAAGEELDARASVDAASLDGASPPPPGGKQLGVTADFLNKTLTVFDVDKLVAGATRADVQVASVDLSKYTPGPMSFGISPDGKLALVSISRGFLGSFIDVPAGDGTLVFVDLQTYQVTGELFTGKGPMGVAFSKDGKRAFVGHFSESYFAVVDVEKRTFSKVNTGASYNEEFAVDDTGTVAALTYGAAGNVKTFGVEDPAGSLGQTSGIGGDAAGVAFFPGTKIAYLVQAPTTLTLNVGGHNLIDVSDPARPVSLDEVRSNSHPTVYPITAVAARGSVAFPSTSGGKLSVIEMKLDGKVAKESARVEVGAAASLAYGVTATPDGRVIVASSGEHYLGVANLETGAAYTVPWDLTKSGPTEVKIIPR